MKEPDCVRVFNNLNQQKFSSIQFGIVSEPQKRCVLRKNYIALEPFGIRQCETPKILLNKKIVGK